MLRNGLSLEACKGKTSVDFRRVVQHTKPLSYFCRYYVDTRGSCYLLRRPCPNAGSCCSPSALEFAEVGPRCVDLNFSPVVLAAPFFYKTLSAFATRPACTCTATAAPQECVGVSAVMGGSGDGTVDTFLCCPARMISALFFVPIIIIGAGVRKSASE